MAKGRVLVIEDDPDGMASVSQAVEDAGFEVVTAATGEDGLRKFSECNPSIVLSDLVLPGIDGLQVLEKCTAENPSVPFIMMTAYGTVDSSVRALKAGAYDYVQKPLNLDDLEASLKRAAETSLLRNRVEVLAGEANSRFSLKSIVAESREMRRVVDRVRMVADASASVLIRGESGTGKELVARALHAEGARARGPFVAVNCGAFAESLLESELFGHEKGAFTGAVSRRLGAFERADGGTLFLDEIGDAPMSVQVKLLRAIEEREICRVGGGEPVKVDVRIVSATNRDLEKSVADGAFREDLLYRLQVVEISIPPLRERPADIRPMAQCFIAEACLRNGRKIDVVDDGYYAALERLPWPGNARQLRNAVESSILLCPKSTLDASALFDAGASPRASGNFSVPPGMTLDQIEREVIAKTLDRNGGNRSTTAEQLGLSRRTIQRKIQELGLE